MKILYATTVSSTMSFFTSHINMLLDQGHKVDLVCNYDLPINPQLLERGCNVFYIELQRSPLKIQNYKAYRKLKKLIYDQQYEIVHTHTPIASVCTRLACRNLQNVKVMYTAHGFHFYKGAPLQNWIIYYPIEWWMSRYTDTLITINKEDYSLAKKSFKAKRVEYIPGVGIDVKKYNQAVVDKKTKRSEIGIPENSTLVLSVGELNKNKNHETIINALAKLGDESVYYVICGQGPLKENLMSLAEELGIGNKVKLLGFRKDIEEICKISDIFVFPSKREGLGLAALEAMASGLPIITSNVHGIVDYSVNELTGFTCDPTDVDGFANSIKYLINNKTIRDKISENNMSLVKDFDIQNVLFSLKKIY